MNTQEGWTVVSKVKKTRKLKTSEQIGENSDGSDTMDTVENNTVDVSNTDLDGSGELMVLPSIYNVWYHDIYNKDWSLNGYTKLCKISNVSEFWRLFNNLDKLGYKFNNLFFMKEDTDPTWEHINNRDGGICSLKVDLGKSLLAYEDLCAHLVCNVLTSMMDDINGISYSPKSTWAIIKIWNKNKNNDVAKLLNINLSKQYQDCCIRYKPNEPEY